jgi:hypothetical protein
MRPSPYRLRVRIHSSKLLSESPLDLSTSLDFVGFKGCRPRRTLRDNQQQGDTHKPARRNPLSRFRDSPHQRIGDPLILVSSFTTPEGPKLRRSRSRAPRRARVTSSCLAARALAAFRTPLATMPCTATRVADGDTVDRARWRDASAAPSTSGVPAGVAHQSESRCRGRLEYARGSAPSSVWPRGGPRRVAAENAGRCESDPTADRSAGLPAK